MARSVATVLVLALLGGCRGGPAGLPQPPSFHHDEISVQIAGGGDVKIGRTPYQAEIETSSDSSFMCNGVIIGDRWVLTTAYCVQYVEAPAVQVRVGTSVMEDGGKVFAVTNMKRHPNFTLDTMAFNLALLETKTKIGKTPTVMPARLVASGKEPKGGEKLIVSSWGSNSMFQMGPWYPRNLKALTVTLTSRPLCKLAYSSNRAVDDTMICATAVQWEGVCAGDDGGPLVNDLGEVVGIVSGPQPSCGTPGWPGIFTNLANADIHQWICSTPQICRKT